MGDKKPPIGKGPVTGGPYGKGKGKGGGDYRIGYEDGMAAGWQMGYKDGKNAGYNDGKNAGYNDGKNAGGKNAVEEPEEVWPKVQCPLCFHEFVWVAAHLRDKKKCRDRLPEIAETHPELYQETQKLITEENEYYQRQPK